MDAPFQPPGAQLEVRNLTLEVYTRALDLGRTLPVGSASLQNLAGKETQNAPSQIYSLFPLLSTVNYSLVCSLFAASDLRSCVFAKNS